MPPSTTAIVYRVAYRRDKWRENAWKYKLFNSEAQARKYVDNLLKPVTEDTPEKFRNLGRATVRLSFGVVHRWDAVPDEDGVTELVQAPIPDDDDDYDEEADTEAVRRAMEAAERRERGDEA